MTVLGPGGYPKSHYGSFAGKPSSGGRVYTQQFSVLGAGGYPRSPYGSFAKGGGGKVYTQQFTVLSPQGVSRPPYGSFAGRHPAPPPSLPVVSGAVTYLLMYSSKGAALGDKVLAQYYNPALPVPVNCCQDVLVYDSVTGQIDPRWGIFVTLPAPIVSALWFDPNLELVIDSPNSLAGISFVVENFLPRDAKNYRFLVSGLGPFPLKF